MIKMNRKQKTHAKYWASSGSNTLIEAFQDSPLYIERNPNIDMYRVNSKDRRGVPVELMGYTPHFKALQIKVNWYIRRNSKRRG